MNPGEFRTIEVEVISVTRVDVIIPPKLPELYIVSDHPSSSPTIADPVYHFRYDVTSDNLGAYQEFVSVYTRSDYNKFFLNFTDELFVLATAETYTFQIDAILTNYGETFASADSSEIGSISVSIEVNAPPQGGICEVQPPVALQMEPIIVGCYGWFDDHSPLTYEVVMHTASQSIPKGTLLSRNPKPSFLDGKSQSVWVEIAVAYIGTHVLEIKIYDSHLWPASHTLPLTIEENPDIEIYAPSQCPSMYPTPANPTRAPTTSPTTSPTASPTTKPSIAPSAEDPTVAPTSPPTEFPTNSPTYSPIDIGSGRVSTSKNQSASTGEDYSMEYTVLIYMAIFIGCFGSFTYVYMNYIADPLYAKIREWMTVEEVVVHPSIYDEPDH